MHTHDHFTVDTLPEPVIGDSSAYWDGDTQYTLSANNDNWILFRHSRGQAHPLGTIRRTDSGWTASALGRAQLHRKSLDDVALPDALLHIM